MKIIIAGSRDIEDYELLKETIVNSGFEISHVVSGGARGVDTMAVRWALEHELPYTVFPAQWNKYRAMGQIKKAGFVRNKTMAENGEALIALHNGSRGTASMIELARKHNLPIYEYEIKPQTKKFNMDLLD